MSESFFRSPSTNSSDNYNGRSTPPHRNMNSSTYTYQPSPVMSPLPPSIVLPSSLSSSSSASNSSSSTNTLPSTSIPSSHIHRNPVLNPHAGYHVVRDADIHSTQPNKTNSRNHSHHPPS